MYRKTVSREAAGGSASHLHLLYKVAREIPSCWATAFLACKVSPCLLSMERMTARWVSAANFFRAPGSAHGRQDRVVGTVVLRL